jgi:hypothetical protein
MNVALTYFVNIIFYFSNYVRISAVSCTLQQVFNRFLPFPFIEYHILLRT